MREYYCCGRVFLAVKLAQIAVHVGIVVVAVYLDVLHRYSLGQGDSVLQSGRVFDASVSSLVGFRRIRGHH